MSETEKDERLAAFNEWLPVGDDGIAVKTSMEAAFDAGWAAGRAAQREADAVIAEQYRSPNLTSPGTSSTNPIGPSIADAIRGASDV